MVRQKKKVNCEMVKYHSQMKGGMQSYVPTDGITIQQDIYSWQEVTDELIKSQFTDPHSFLRATLLPILLTAIAFVPGIGELAIVAEVANAVLTLTNVIQEGGDPASITVDVLMLSTRFLKIPRLPPGALSAVQKLETMTEIAAKLNTIRESVPLVCQQIGDLYKKNDNGTYTGPVPGSEASNIAIDKLLQYNDLKYNWAYANNKEQRDGDGGPTDICLRYPYWPNNSSWSSPYGTQGQIYAVIKTFSDILYKLNTLNNDSTLSGKRFIPSIKYPIISNELNTYYTTKFKTYSLKKAIIEAYTNFINSNPSPEYDIKNINANMLIAINNAIEIINKKDVITATKGNLELKNLLLDSIHIKTNIIKLNAELTTPVFNAVQNTLALGLANYNDFVNSTITTKNNIQITTSNLNDSLIIIKNLFLKYPSLFDKSNQSNDSIIIITKNNIETINENYTTQINDIISGIHNRLLTAQYNYDNKITDLKNDPVKLKQYRTSAIADYARNKPRTPEQLAADKLAADQLAAEQARSLVPTEYSPFNFLGGNRGLVNYAIAKDNKFENNFNLRNFKIKDLIIEFESPPKVKGISLGGTEYWRDPPNWTTPGLIITRTESPLITSFGWTLAIPDTSDYSFLNKVAQGSEGVSSNAVPPKYIRSITKYPNLCGMDLYEPFATLYDGPINSAGWFCGYANEIPTLTQWNVLYPDYPDKIPIIDIITYDIVTLDFDITRKSIKTEWTPPQYDNLPQAVIANSLIAFFYMTQKGAFPILTHNAIDYLNDPIQIANSKAVCFAAAQTQQEQHILKIAQEMEVTAGRNDTLLSTVLTLKEQAALSFGLSENDFNLMMERRRLLQPKIALEHIDTINNVDSATKRRDTKLNDWKVAVAKFQQGWYDYLYPIYMKYKETGGENAVQTIFGDLLTNVQTYSFGADEYKRLINTFYNKGMYGEVDTSTIIFPTTDDLNWKGIQPMKEVIDTYFNIITQDISHSSPISFYEHSDIISATNNPIYNKSTVAWINWLTKKLPTLYTENDTIIAKDPSNFMYSIMPPDVEIGTPYLLYELENALNFYNTKLKEHPTTFDTDGNPTYKTVYPPSLMYEQINIPLPTILTYEQLFVWYVYYNSYSKDYNSKGITVGNYYDNFDNDKTKKPFFDVKLRAAAVLPDDIKRASSETQILQGKFDEAIKKASSKDSTTAMLGMQALEQLSGGFITRRNKGIPAYMMIQHRTRHRV